MNHGLWLDFAIAVTPEVGVCCLGHLICGRTTGSLFTLIAQVFGYLGALGLWAVGCGQCGESFLVLSHSADWLTRLVRYPSAPVPKWV